MKNKTLNNAFPIVAAVLGNKLGVNVFGGSDAYTTGKIINIPAYNLDDLSYVSLNPWHSGFYSSGMNDCPPRPIENDGLTVTGSFSPETPANGSSAFCAWPWIMIVKSA